MKDVAMPQTLIQVDRDILKHCRMCSIGEIFISQSVCTKEHLHRAVFGGVSLHLDSCEFNFSAHLCWDISASADHFFCTDLYFLYNL